MDACTALDDLLILRLYADQRDEWITNVFITRLWLSTEKLTESDAIKPVRATIAALWSYLKAPLPAQTTHAAQVVFVR